MNNPPTGKSVTCPLCDEVATAIVPRGSTIVEQETVADGKVWVNCPDCGTRFLAYYQLD